MTDKPPVSYPSPVSYPAPPPIITKAGKLVIDIALKILGVNKVQCDDTGLYTYKMPSYVNAYRMAKRLSNDGFEAWATNRRTLHVWRRSACR